VSLPRASFWQRCFLAALVLLLLGWGSYYVYEKGFGRRWRITLAREFRRYGLVINVRRLTLDPLRGLIAQDVDIFQDEAMENLLARVSNLSLDIDYAALLQHEPALNAVDLQNARLSIPIGSDHGTSMRLQATRVQARIYFVPGRIEVRQLSGNVLGIHCAASGTLINRVGYVPKANAPAAGPTDDFVSKLLVEIRRLHFSRGTPQLNFTFRGDLADLSSLQIEDGTLLASHIERFGYSLERLSVDFNLQQRRLEVRHLEVHDHAGTASAAGTWDFVSGRKTFEVQSSLDLASFLGTDPRCFWASDWTFAQGPTVELGGDVRLDGHVRYLGRLHCGPFTFRQVPFTGMRADFSKDGTSWMVTGVEVAQGTGTVSGEALRHDGSFRLRLQSAIDPSAVAPLLPRSVQKQFAGWEFLASPVVQLDLHGPRPSFQHLLGSGQVLLGRTRYQGTLINSGSARFQLASATLHFDPVHISRDDGEASGTFTYDPLRQRLAIEQLHAELPPLILAGWFRPELRPYFEGWRCPQNPVTTGSGVFGAQKAVMPEFYVQVKAQGATHWRYGGHEFPLENLEIAASTGPGQPLVVQGQGGCYGGRWTARLTYQVPSGERNVFVQATQVDLAPLEPRFPFLRGCTGLFSGHLELLENRKNVKVLTGEFRLAGTPFGESVLLRSVYPRLRAAGLPTSGDLAVQFTGDGVEVGIPAFVYQADGHRLELQGTMGSLGAPLNLSGSLDGRLPVRAAGSLFDPDWEVGSLSPGPGAP
ncbi:MAG TPA: hypothetical protein VGD78_14155, partial [Chthoniobacterales bacterium]